MIQRILFQKRQNDGIKNINNKYSCFPFLQKLRFADLTPHVNFEVKITSVNINRFKINSHLFFIDMDKNTKIQKDMGKKFILQKR